MTLLSLISNGASFHFWMGSAVTLLIIDVVLIIATAILAVIVKRMEKKAKRLGLLEDEDGETD